jgi:hypothetical protein
MIEGTGAFNIAYGRWPVKKDKGGKEISLGNLFSTFKYPFLPWTIFFNGTRQTIVHLGNSLL